MNKITYNPIGIIHSPFKKAEGTPIQPTASKAEGTVEVFREFVQGLEDLDNFSHVFLIYHFHLIKNFKLKAKPFMDQNSHGIFSIRAPARPNSIGFSVVRLEKIEDNILYVKNIDIIDGTPLLDIKPYVPEFDVRQDAVKGWLKNNVHKLPNTKDDARFIK